MPQIKCERSLGGGGLLRQQYFRHRAACLTAIAAFAKHQFSGDLVRCKPAVSWLSAFLGQVGLDRTRSRAELWKGVIGGQRYWLFVRLIAFAMITSQLIVTPARAQTAPPPPGLDAAYYTKEKDPGDPKGKKERPTKIVRPAKCPQCQAARDALQEAIENWYQFQANDAQQKIDAENNKKKPDKNTVNKFTNLKNDALKGAKEHPNAPKTKDALTAEIDKLRKAFDECEKDPCGPKEDKSVTHTPGFPGPKATPKEIADWIENFSYPDCADDKEKTKKEMKQRLDDAQKAAARIPANSELAKEVAPYLKKLQDFVDKGIGELPPCTVTHTDGFTELPKPIKSDDDIKTIVEWINGLTAKLPHCSDDKDKTKQQIEQMLNDANNAVGYLQQASQVNKFSKQAVEALKATQETLKKIKDFVDNKIQDLPPCKKGDILKGPKMIFHGFGYYSRPGGGQTYAVTYVDSGENCTFGRSEPISMPLTPTDVSFNPIRADVVPPGGGDGPVTRADIPATDTPKRPTTEAPSVTPVLPTVDKPTVSDTPKAPTDTPQPPADKPTTAADTPPAEPPKTPDQAKTPEQPTTEKPPSDTPPVTTTEARPTDDIVILFKGDQAVLERGQTGDPLNGEHLMLVFKKPDLRESGTGKPATDDSGFDKNGVHAVTGVDGQAKLTVPAEDRALYLSSLGDNPNKYYRVDADALKNTGSVSEVAPNAKPDLSSGAPNGGTVVAEVFKIGDRTFVRRLYSAPFGVNVVLLGDQKVDWCRVVEPGPALGMEPEYPSALHLELPHATIKLPQSRRSGLEPE